MRFTSTGRILEMQQEVCKRGAGWWRWDGKWIGPFATKQRAETAVKPTAKEKALA